MRKPAAHEEHQQHSHTPQHAYVTLAGRTHRLPGPLALVQTDAGGGGQAITHINGLSLEQIAASCPLVDAGGANGSRATAAEDACLPLLTSVTRGSTRVQALMVVAVHAALLGKAGPSAGAGAAPTGAGGDAGADVGADVGADAAAAEQRSLMRAAARLTWGLAGLVFELMHTAAGHWPALGPVERQAVAGTALTQLYGLNRALALGVLRAYGQLNHERFAEMLDSGLLPAPAHTAAAASAAAPAGEPCSAGEAAQAGAAPAAALREAEEAAAQV